jgi:hypothetical protein
VKRIDPDLAVPRHVEFVIRESQLGDQLTKNEHPIFLYLYKDLSLTKTALNNFLGVKMLKFFDADPGRKKFG